MARINFEEGQKLALISVFNKEGIVEFARGLVELGWKIISSGGTAKKLTEGGVPVTDVAELVGGAAILGHRVVTLSREIGAALLADRNSEADMAEMKELNLPIIDLVCCDFYPLVKAIAEHGEDPDKIVEMTDIGGPNMIREAAKGNRIVICDAADRQWVLNELKANNNDLTAEQLQWMRAKAEHEVAKYVFASAKYHGNGEFAGLMGRKTADCKYGENPYMTPAAFYSCDTKDPLAINKFKLVQGTDPSFINGTDIDRLLQTMAHLAAGFDLNFNEVPCIGTGVKHGNPCGAAYGDDPAEVIKNMVMGDHLAIFGGFVMFNFKLTAELVEILLTTNMPPGKRLLLDGVICPSITDEAIEMLKRKGDKCRILTNPALASLNKDSLDTAERIRPVRGGFLKQPNYTYILNLKDPQLVITGTTDKLSLEDQKLIVLNWAVGCTSNSNTTTLGSDDGLLGNGVGQQSRVASCQVAIFRSANSGHLTRGAVAYTDSFFPEPDGPEELAKAGVKIVFASSGSIKDEIIRTRCKELDIILVQLPDKVCRGFFGH